MNRETPTKITHDATMLKCCTCPRCGNVLDKFENIEGNNIRVTFEYCFFCGQRLDWEEEKKFCKNKDDGQKN